MTVRGEPLITDAERTDVVEWWGSMSNVLRDLSNGARLTWALRGPEVKSATLDRAPAQHILMRECRRFFERMQILNPCNNRNDDVGLAYKRYFGDV